MNNALAPIVLFTYNRPQHLLACLQSLRENVLADQSVLYVYADGPKAGAGEEELAKIKETRLLLKKESWCKEVHIVEQNENKGLANSIIKGVTEIVNKYGKIIVLEDDLILSTHFLEYMNQALTVYAPIENVYSVNGFTFPIKTNERSTFLLPYTSTWGWGTWKNRWDIFEPDIKEEDKNTLLNSPELKQRFNLADYDYGAMLHFKNNSWGIKWYYAVFKRNGLNVFPTVSMVKNSGNDGSGTNPGKENVSTNFDKSNAVSVKTENTLHLKYLSLYLQLFSTPKRSFLKRIVAKLLG